jgi:cytochrome b561
MPDVHAGPPGIPMIWHIFMGMLFLASIVARLLWRVTHPVAPESSRLLGSG